MSNDRSHVVEQVDDFVHGVLKNDAAAVVEKHCSECESCQAELELARRRHALLAEIPMTEASEDLIQKTVGQIENRVLRRARFRRRYMKFVCSATAASILIIGSLNIYYQNLSASPFDLRILGQTALQAGSAASLRITVFDQSAKTPLASVPITLLLVNPRTKKKVELASFQTNKGGSGNPRFELPDWEAGQYQLRVIARPGGIEEIVSRTITLKRTSKLLVSTDKPIYQPGQTIKIRALSLLKPDLKPVIGAKSEFSITDPKGNVIYRKHAKTSDYGITSTACPLAREIIEGPYTVTCRIEGTESSITVKVEKYVLPKFQISVKLDRSWYLPGQQVRGTVQADYFFGKPVAEGSFEVVAQAQEIGVKQIFHAKDLKLDPQGRGTFEFALPTSMVGREQNSGNSRVALAVTVIDSANQKHTVTLGRIVTSQPISIDVIPETGTLVRDVPNRIFLFASYADGKPAKTTLFVTGPAKDIEIVTSELGVGVIELTPKTDGVGLTIRATDAAGDIIGRKHVALTCGQAASDFLLRTDKAVYRGGDTINVTALGGGVETVFIDFIKDKQTVLTETLQIQDGKGELQFDLPIELFGTMEICAYRYGPSGLPVMKRRAIFIEQANDLTITAKLDQSEYRPGKKAQLRLTMTDEKGKPVVGAISLSAVDEAVYAVMSHKPGMEETFFQLEQELLKPVYQIYNWHPAFNVEPGLMAERQEFEQALFAKTAADVTAAPGTGNSPWSLQATSYPSKVEQVRVDRILGLRNVELAWKWLAWSGAGALLLAFAIYFTRAFLIICGVLGGLGIIVVGLMALIYRTQQAREAPPSASLISKVLAGGVTAAAPMDGAPWDAAIDTKDEAAAGSEDPTSPPETVQKNVEPIRVREWFPETLLWKPEMITDHNGVATVEIDLADSITTWRLSASGVSGSGALGAMSSGIRVFQPFFVDLNLPVALTRNDEVAVPVVVYNYLDKPNQVQLRLESDEWFTLLDGEESRNLVVELKPNEVRSVSFRIRAKDVGRHHLQVTARGADISDAIRREITVEPDGVQIAEVINGALLDPAIVSLHVPDHVIPGSVKAIVKLYPSSFSQLLEGLDGIFQRPSGCFEQTSSTTYPNVLALDYLKRTKLSAPKVELKARQYIHLGYQKLLGFEVDGGGFDWFGNPPANQTLTAYGLMKFVDMAAVHDVDPKLINRTRSWLLRRRAGDGSWKADRGMLNDGLAGSVQQGADLDLATTAYVGWAVFAKNQPNNNSQRTLDYLLAHRPETIQSVNVLATVANALLAIEPTGDSAAAYLVRLNDLKKSSEDGKTVWWEQGEGQETMFHGSGRAGNVETTALATMALLQGKQHAAPAKAALNWLVEQKGADGLWYSTQATVLALKALIMGTGTAIGGDEERQIEVLLDDQIVKTITISADQANVMQQLNLSDLISQPQHTLTLRDKTGTGTGYQIAFSYHVPETDEGPAPTEALTIRIEYDRRKLSVNETVAVTASITNNRDARAPMVLIDLPIPAGFRIETGDLSKLQRQGQIAKFTVNQRSAVIYLRGLPAREEIELKYKLKATMPVKLTVPAATVYEYYNPDRKGRSNVITMEVTH